nr:putative capsid protein [Picobirnavirus sp.]
MKMTSNGIEMQKLQETKRHNQAGMDEHIGTHLGSALGSAAIGTLGRIGSALIKKNDISYYDQEESLYLSSTKLSFPIKKGTPMFNSRGIVPSMVVHHWAPTIGTLKGTTVNTPIMRAFKKLFNTVRGENSGASNYDSVDLGIVSLAIDSIETLIEEAIKALRVVSKTVELNPITTKNISIALGYNYNGMINNKEEWINVINKAINDLNSLMIPGGLSYFKKHRFMAQHLFTEKDINEEEYFRSNYHAFKCKVYFIYDEANGELDANATVNSYTPSSWQTMIDAMLLPLINSQAVALMTGDVKNAVNRGAISPELLHHMDNITLADIEGIFPLLYEKDFLMQIRNARYLGKPLSSSSWAEQLSIHQSTTPAGDPFVYQGKLDAFGSPYGITVLNEFYNKTISYSDDEPLYRKPGYRFLFSTHDYPSNEEIMESTRLSIFTTQDIIAFSLLTTTQEIILQEHGSEILLYGEVFQYNGDQNYEADSIASFELTGTNVYSSIYNLDEVFLSIMNFKYFPMITIHYLPSSGSAGTLCNYYSYAYRPITPQELRPIHECALRSEFTYQFNKGNSQLETKSSYSNNNHRKFSKRSKNKKANKKFEKPSK